ncbi:hypothetical protein CLIB1423_04S03862 [[Candida] railenensis]|uniref:Uncharacterized protein n=1 Tax=[Candida] railenensis TaxID=45579 RepID=A0A9P0VXM8_9ASCO|nr:hypothetical protein CLIB1423_04S03862 [[Candida] railenensis]
MDKENIPTTPKREESAHSSPSRPLKPVSPNKVQNAYVGKLSFLQNDNIDAHFSHIHSTQEELQVTLQKLEVQTAQTALDLGQLVDRSKNNNSYLNKLLEGISAKDDENSDAIRRSDLEEILNKIEEIQGSRGTHDDNSEKFEGLVEEILKAFQQRNGDLIESVEDSKVKITSQFSQMHKDIESTITTSFRKEQERMVSEQQKLSDLTTSLTRQLAEQQTVIQGLISKNQDVDQLEGKISTLQGKYEQLCAAYSSKFNDLKSLKEEYTELQRMTEAFQDDSQSTQQSQVHLPKRISKANKFNQLNQLHSTNLSHIQEYGNGLPMQYADKRASQKRIASTPNKLFVDESGSTSATMSD